MEDNHNGSPNKTPLPEKICGAIGLALTLAAVIHLVYSGVQPKGPPDLRIKARRITRQGDAYLVEFELRNVGHQTAKAAVIEGRLLPMKESPSDQEPIETRETEFDYAPSNSVHKGGLYFNHDPKDYVLEFKAKSYVVP